MRARAKAAPECRLCRRQGKKKRETPYHDGGDGSQHVVQVPRLIDAARLERDLSRGVMGAGKVCVGFDCHHKGWGSRAEWKSRPPRTQLEEKRKGAAISGKGPNAARWAPTRERQPPHRARTNLCAAAAHAESHRVHVDGVGLANRLRLPVVIRERLRERRVREIRDVQRLRTPCVAHALIPSVVRSCLETQISDPFEPRCS